MQHVMGKGKGFIEIAVDLPKQMLSMQLVMHTP
jgi:hypothetical protein